MTAAVSTKVTSWLTNAPQANTCWSTSKAPPSSPPPPARPISGVRNDSANWSTTAVKAAPMTTATASSTTLPRSRKSLKPLNTASSTHTGRSRSSTRRGAWREAQRQCGGGGGGGEPGCRVAVDGEQQQAVVVRTRGGEDGRPRGDDLGPGGPRRRGRGVDPVAGLHERAHREGGRAPRRADRRGGELRGGAGPGQPGVGQRLAGPDAAGQ